MNEIHISNILKSHILKNPRNIHQIPSQTLIKFSSKVFQPGGEATAAPRRYSAASGHGVPDGHGGPSTRGRGGGTAMWGPWGQGWMGGKSLVMTNIAMENHGFSWDNPL